MEETLASQKMEENDLINSLENISSDMPNRIFRLQGYMQKKSPRKIRNIYIQGLH